MTERVYVNTDDVCVSEEDMKYVERVRRRVYSSLDGEEAEVAICVWMYTPKRLDKLRNCIDSVMKYTSHIKFKLVLANNGGGKEIEEFYENIDYNDKMIINISSNIGSPHGASVITRHVRNKFCVELLNDCVVTANWLDNLLRCIKSDDTIGMVCPMATNTSNMQIPDTGDVDIRDLEALQEFAVKYNVSNPAKWEERLRLMPICGIYRREALEMAGIADPGYLHEFADDDHCMRIRRAGYKLILCGDTFVHHDHFMDERNVKVEQGNTNVGKNGFLRKFKGIEPWRDFVNFVFPYIRSATIADTKEQYRVLGIDVKCGTPILDVKNCYRRNGIDTEKLCITDYTQEVKYYTDLMTVADEVIHDDVHNMRSHLKEKYDFIVLGNPINSYSKSLAVLDELADMLTDGGYFLFSLKNLYNIDTLFALLGDGRPQSGEIEAIHYKDICDKIGKLKLRDATFYQEMTQFNCEEINMVRNSLVEVGVIAKENEEATHQWEVNNYWFIIQK